MNKIELKDIAGYLPHDLKILDKGNVFSIESYESKKFTEWNEGGDKELIVATNGEKWIEEVITEIKPILRPLSDLYKSITHNGKEIVPIVELAKMAELYLGYGDNWIFDIEKYGECAVCLDCRLEYADCGFWAWIDTGKRMHSNRILNQYQLFDYLHELKIDYRNLIDSGLAVSVYDLKENPYK